MKDKRHRLRVIKAVGPRGEPGLSAYGVWLKEGNCGTVDDFLHALQRDRQLLLLHSGGQLVKPLSSVSLMHMTGQLRTGCYIAQWMLWAGEGTCALFVEGGEQNNTRFAARGVLHAVCTLRIFSPQSTVEIKNVSPSPVHIGADPQCVDAWLLLRPID